MTDENLFDNKENKQEPQANNIPADVADLIGEGKKYATIEAALKGLKAAQEHIAKLEGENAEFRTKTDFSKEAVEIKERELERLQEEFKQLLRQPNKPDPAPAPVEDNNKGSNGNAQPVDVNALVEQAINLRAQRDMAEQNKKAVIETMITLHGAKASETFYETGAAWGFNKEQMNALAETNPKAVFKMFNVEPNKQKLNTQAKGFNKPTVPQRDVNWNSDKDTIARMNELRTAIAAKYQP